MFSSAIRSRWLRSVALRLVAYAAIAYLTAGAFFYFMQSKLLFPAPKHFDAIDPARAGVQFQDLRILVRATDYLHAWWIPSAMPSQNVIVVFHGNGYALGDMATGEAADLHRIGANLLLIDYRGYGSSTLLAPSESTVEQDAEAALDYLLRDRSIPIRNVFVLGRSIGSGPATYLAVKNEGLGGLFWRAHSPALTTWRGVTGIFGSTQPRSCCERT